MAALGFRLVRGDWIAAAAPISEGGECRDRLTFAALPVLAGGYELQVVGLSADDRLRWHKICPGLLPDGDAASAAEATARECTIARLPEG